jgi:hypothetical protein
MIAYAYVKQLGKGCVNSSATVSNVRYGRCIIRHIESFEWTCCGTVTALKAAQEVATVKLVLAAGASARTANDRGNMC